MKRILSLVLSCAVAMCSMVTVGCTPQQKLAVVTDIERFIPVVTNVADAVCGFTPAAPICIGGVTAVSASAKVLSTAVVNYYTAVASGTVPPGVIAALNQALSTFEGDASSILDSVRILNPTLQTEIQALVASAQVLLAVVEGLLPSAVQSTKFAAAKPSRFNLGNFASDYNKQVDAVQKAVPRSVSLKKVHAHSPMLRFVSLGIAK